MSRRDAHLDRGRRWLLGALSASAIGLTRASIPASVPFRAFDAMLQRDKPDLRPRGLEPIAAVAQIWRSGHSHDLVDPVGIALALERIPPHIEAFFFDVEEWQVFRQPAAVLAASIDKLLRVAEVTRRERPELKFGFYGLPPAGTYWPILLRDATYDQWLAVNRAMAPVAAAVDFLFPSLYTFYDDRAGWLAFATAQIAEARRYRKPVFPFLWFEYFDQNETLHDQEVITPAWEEELRLCREQADGVVIWGGYQRHWNEQAAWWQSTRRILELPGT